MRETFENLKNLWAGLPKARRISLIVVAVVVLTALFSLILFFNRPNLQILFGKLPNEDAARVVEVLKERKVEHQALPNADGTTTIKVPAEKVHDLRLQLVQAGVPRQSDTSGGVGFELFDKPTFGMSDFMQKANYIRALQGELARTIRAMEEVEEARVMIVVPEERLFSKERRESKASVLITLKRNAQLGPEKVKSIQFLVASSVEGLQPAKVTVVDSKGRPLSEEDGASGIGALTSTQLKAQKAYEEHVRRKAQGLLDQVLGYGQSVVEVTAQLDFDSVSQTSERIDPKVQAIREETLANENIQSKTESLSGVAGTQPNTEIRSSADSGAMTSSSQIRENQTNRYDYNRQVETRQKAGGEVRRLSIAVSVNVRKTGEGATASVQVRTPQELQELENIVKNAVGFVNNETRQDTITIQETAFAGTFEPVVAQAADSTFGVPNSILPYVSQGFLVLAAIGLLLYLRHILKATSEEESDAAGEFASLLGRYKRMADDAMAEVNRDKSPPPFLTAEELGKLIRDNPGNTSSAIRVWLSRN